MTAKLKETMSFLQAACTYYLKSLHDDPFKMAMHFQATIVPILPASCEVMSLYVQALSYYIYDELL